MRTESIRLYDNPNRAMIELQEVVYSPGEEAERAESVVHWRKAKQVGQWVQLDDGGICRVIRLSRYRRGKDWITTACGEGRPDKEGDKIFSTGKFSASCSRYTYKDFVEVFSGVWMPRKIKRYCDYLLMGLQPIQAYELAHPNRSFWRKETEKYPKVLQRQLSQDRCRARSLMDRPDVQQYMNESLRDRLSANGLGREDLLGKVGDLIDDEKTSSTVKAKLIMELLGVHEGKTVGGAGSKDERGPVSGMEEDNKGKLKLIRQKRRSQPVITVEPEEATG